MNTKKKTDYLRDKIQQALDKAPKKIIEEEKGRNGYIVIGKNRKVEKIPARSL